MHHQEEELIEMPGNKRQSYECPKCKNNYSTAYSMYRHMRKVHNCEVNRCVTLYCPIENCNQSYDRYNALDTHLTHVHYLDIRKETLNFQKVDDFETWLQEVMASSKTKYIKRSCNDVYRYYRCHRSGLPKTSTDKINTMKSSVKIGRHCPSRIIAKMTEGQVQVEFVPTHIGHNCEVSKIPLSPERRLDMKNKLSSTTTTSVTSSDSGVTGQQVNMSNSNGLPTTAINTENRQQQQQQQQQVTSIQTDNSMIVSLVPLKPNGDDGRGVNQGNQIIPQLQQPPQQQQQPNRNMMLMNSINTRRRELTSKFEELMLSISSEKHAAIIRAQLEVCFALIKD